MKMKEEKKQRSFGALVRQLFGGGHPPLPESVEELQGPMRVAVLHFLHNKIAMTGLVIFLVLFVSSFVITPFMGLDLSYQDVTQQNLSPGFGMRNAPEPMQKSPKSVSPGASFGAGIGQDGKAYLWGKTDEKQRKIPEMGKLNAISAGQNHILALDENGKLYTWGYSRFSLERIPGEVSMMGDIKQIEAGYQLSMALSEAGELAVWGNENLIDINLAPYQGNIRKAVSNSTTILGLLEDGTVASMSTRETIFSRVPDWVQGNVTDIATGDQAAIALTTTGEVAVWGNLLYGMDRIPEELTGKRVVQIAAGRFHFTALTEDGKLYSWGRDNMGQCKIPGSVAKEKVTQIYAGYYQNYAVTETGKLVSWGQDGTLMGTDGLGRDIALRLVAGGRMTMTIGAIAVLISTVIGVLIGGLAGYYGGTVDNLLMRFAEIIGSLPFLPLAMILSTLIGNRMSETGRISMIMVILGVLSWPGLARLTRAQILAEREKEFVTAAKAVGIREGKIIFRHILPNVMTVVIVNATLNFAASLLTESSLSFLGFGVVEPNPTWGNMLTGSQSSTVIATYWWRWVFPAAALSLATISINLIGDGLRDAIDPKSGER